MKKITIMTLIFVGFLSTSGCDKCTKNETAEKEKQQEELPIATLVAKYTDKPVVVDGKLDDPCWETAAVYKLGLSADRVTQGLELKEGGEVRFAWDDSICIWRRVLRILILLQREKKTNCTITGLVICASCS